MKQKAFNHEERKGFAKASKGGRKEDRAKKDVLVSPWQQTRSASRTSRDPGELCGQELFYLPPYDESIMRRILIATSNPGKLRDFAGAALRHGIEIAAIPDFASLPPVVEDGLTFEANARKKAEAYSKYAPGQIVVADDSGLEIDALNDAPGVHSARYAAPELQNKQPHEAEANTDDEANNARVLRELRNVPFGRRTGRFVCVLAAARDGATLATFRGTAEGIILEAALGANGFGYDPLFYFPAIEKTFAELSAEEKSNYSHRGAAFRKLLESFECFLGS